MPRFRAALPCARPAPVNPESITRTIAEVSHPAHFFAHGLSLHWQESTEEIPWEIFRGRLLDAGQTRERRQFQSWSAFQVTDGGSSAEPLLSVKWAREVGELHVVRALPCHAWEAYDGGGNVILSRETVKWARELVGSIAITDYRSTDELRDELTCLLFQAVVGMSRLPLTSLEAPLPAFTFGQLAYVFRAEVALPVSSEPGMRSWQDLIDRALNGDLAGRERVKVLEFLLRAVPAAELASAAEHFVQRWEALGGALAEIPTLWRAMFHEVSLSPYTDFVDKSLALLGVLVEQRCLAVGDQIDCLSYVLRQLCRHLTAYDLVTFHHRGANYPDALLLDAALKNYLLLARRHPNLLFGAQEPRDQARQRIRRRALRQACLFRWRYAGHAVPDAPTSPGENLRVLPPPHTRVADEQILEPSKRGRRLYADDALAGLLTAGTRRLLQQSLDDLLHADELCELGNAVFVDRPLGMGRPAGAADQTPLVAHEAFSRRVAQMRLREIDRLARDLGLIFCVAEREAQLRYLAVAGLPLSEVCTPDRPMVSLADARRVSDDFMLRRTLPSSVNALLRIFDFHDAERRLGLDLLSSACLWLLPVAEDRLAVFDRTHRKRLELKRGPNFRVRGGMELPVGGFRVVRVWRHLPSGGFEGTTVDDVVASPDDVASQD